MPIIARFVGVNKHLAPEVTDLVGASKDAIALWALFRDTVPDIDAKLIIDEDATVINVRCALLDTLINASENDDLVLAFSGHGTHNHRIVTHDTSISDLESSTISMSEIAECFRKTRAKSVIFILDCCFSGGAPARVLDPTPYSRDLPFVTPSISGKGRVLITASGLNEPAYEHPGYRHGILTYAIIQTLCSSKEELPLLSVMEKVIEEVRSIATTLGCIQTPIAFNLIEGGLNIFSLKPGRYYFSAFPERVGITVSNEVVDLKVFGLPETVLDSWKNNFPDGLNSLQIEAVNNYRILDGESLLVVAPTSSGKTFIGEMASVKAIMEGRKAVFLLPYKALVNEKYDLFSDMYGNGLGMRVIRCTGDFLDDTTPFLMAKFDIAVLTYEMFLSLAIGNSAILGRIGLVVLDEAQFITDDGRGIIVELILTRLNILRKQGMCPQLIALSATIGSLNRFDDWLGIRSLVTNFRPVPLEMGILDTNGLYEYIDQEGNQKVDQFLPKGSIYQRGSKPSAQDVLVPLAHQLISDIQKQEKLLLFRNTRGAAEGCANYLSNELGLPPADEIIETLPSHDLSTTSIKLRKTLTGGVAFHNSNLTRDERVLIERSFRDPKGNVRILVATTTVAAGINTPASTVVLVEHEFLWENKPFTVAEVKNMAGRAGRLGFRETGRAILIAETPFERNRLFQKYILGQPEEVKSSFQSADVGTWMLRLLTQVTKVKSDELVLLIANTYGGFLATLRDPDWQKNTKANLAGLISRMITAGLFNEQDGYINLTLLGRACGESSLSLESVIQLVQMIKRLNTGSMTSLHLMAFVQAMPELDGQFTPLFKKGQRESIWPQELAIALGDSTSQAIQFNTGDYWTYYARAKRACILLDWIQGKSIESIEARFTINPFHSVGAGDIRSIADATRFHLRSVFNIVSILLPSSTSDTSASDQLIKQIEFGIPSTGLSLLTLPFRFTRGEYLALISNDVTILDKFWGFSTEKLNEILGEPRAKEIELFKKRSERQR